MEVILRQPTVVSEMFLGSLTLRLQSPYFPAARKQPNALAAGERRAPRSCQAPILGLKSAVTSSSSPPERLSGADRGGSGKNLEPNAFPLAATADGPVSLILLQLRKGAKPGLLGGDRPPHPRTHAVGRKSTICESVEWG